MARILFAEDDETLRTALEATLESEGYDVCACKDGGEALAEYARRRPDLMLLDVMMPVKSGYDVCVEVRRADPSLPIVFLTAKSAEEDVVLSLGLGADDFIAKPFRIRELLARVSAAMRRSRAAPQAANGGDTFRIGTAVVDVRRFLVSNGEDPAQPLTVRELGLLRMFATHPGEVLMRETLLDEVWGEGYAGTTRTLDQHVVQIRRKLGASGQLIETLRGAGYRLSV
ncbi:MAG: response regulator transcription factor [Kiritimatiellae bacterium]|nr:response regulator transcription factor [Kiritimatiellia bacterium]